MTVIYDSRYDRPLSASQVQPNDGRRYAAAPLFAPQTVRDSSVDDRRVSSPVFSVRKTTPQRDSSPCSATAEEEKSKIGFWGNIGKGMIVGGALGLSIGILASGFGHAFPPEMIIGALVGAGVGGGASGLISANEADVVYSKSLKQCLNSARSW